MIQRIQTVYLAFVALVALVSNWFANLWQEVGVWMQADDNLVLMVIYLVIALISIVAIGLFKNRRLQMKLNAVNILLNVLLVVLMVYFLLELPGGFNSEKGIGLIVPLLLIVLLFLANRSIKKDEKLVKSMDRIR